MSFDPEFSGDARDLAEVGYCPGKSYLFLLTVGGLWNCIKQRSRLTIERAVPFWDCPALSEPPLKMQATLYFLDKIVLISASGLLGE